MSGNVAPDKLIYHMDKVVAKEPITANWFINDVCNNNCRYCSFGMKMNRNHNNITYEDFVRYADRLKELGVRGTIIEGGGEPTICPQFKVMGDYLNKIEMPWILLTNWNVYHEVRPNVLRVSLDAWDEDSYQAKRGVRKYNTVRDNIRQYIRYKREHSPQTEVGIQLVTENDVDEVIRFYEGNRDLDVDYIQIKAYESTDGRFYDDKDVLIGNMQNVIKSIQKEDKRVIYNYKWDSLHERMDKCYAHPYQIALDWNGDVMVCCHRPFDHIGNIMDDDIIEKNRRTEYDMSKCDVPCRLQGPNRFIRAIEQGCHNQWFI